MLALLLAALVQQAGPSEELLAERIRTRLEVGSTLVPLNRLAALSSFYARRSFRPAWSSEHGPNRLADELLNTLQRADLDGLEPADYYLAAIHALLDSVRVETAQGKPPTAHQLAALDLLLSDAFLLYGSHLLAGRVDPEALHRFWDANRRSADLSLVLQDAIESRRVARALQRLAPTHDGYRRLRDALGRLRALAARGGWKPLPDGPPLKLRDRDPMVALLRERLTREGDLRDDDQPTDALLFDEAVEEAVRQFQLRHGLEVDGIVSADTRAELNVSVARRLEQLRLNMERWRWLPQDLGRRRIVVNIAAYELEVIEDEEIVLAMRVMVGRRYRRTPVFSDTVRYIVLNPSWYVPRSIAVSDLLPKIQKDPTYIERYGMRVFEGSAPSQPVDPDSVDWAAVTPDNFSYRLHQEPGRLNALGRIKFMFPNDYDVYLHDTPSRDLFAEPQRDFSSGCIRLEQPLELAVYLMKKDGRWKREALERALDEGMERTIYLPRPTPIHLLYWTAWAEEDGAIHFRPDIHALDQILAKSLAGKRN